MLAVPHRPVPVAALMASWPRLPTRPDRIPSFFGHKTFRYVS
jgi:hypothetical protein